MTLLGCMGEIGPSSVPENTGGSGGSTSAAGGGANPVELHSPSIDLLTATPNEGPSPLNTTLSWKVADLDGEALRCDIDVGADGSADVTIPDCPYASGRQLLLTTSGANPIRLRVTDPTGRSAEQSVTVTVNGPANRAPVITDFAATPASGRPPFSTTLKWSVTEPDNDSLRCDLDVNADGSMEYTLLPCDAAGQRTHMVTAVGPTTIRLTVTDARGAVSTREVVVTGSANRAPVVTAFSASPNAGNVPLATTFTWQISDPDGDPLECQLDVGGNGVDYTLPSCTSSTMRGHTFVGAGTFATTLKVVDPGGLSATRSVSITATVPTHAGSGELSISKVEWGQSVISQNPTLVAEKDALLRIYVLADRPSLTGVVVTAEASAGGVFLGSVSLTGPQSPPTTLTSSSLSTQYRGTVPAAWVKAGLSILIKVDPGNVVAEANENDNTTTLTPNIGVGTVLPVTLVPVVHQGVTPTVPDITPAMLEVWPLKSVDSRTRAPYTTQVVLTATGGWSTLLNDLRAVRTADGSRRYYYGVAKVGFRSGTAGIGYVGSPTALGRNDSVSTAVHELGHNMSLNHAPCGGVSGADASFPYAGAKIGSWGWNATSGVLVNPATSYDVMSYCEPTWVSDYNYRKVQSYLRNSPPVANATAANAQMMLVSGRIMPDGHVVLSPIYTLWAGSSEPAHEGAYWLKVVHADRTFVTAFEADEVAEGGERHFSLRIPDQGPMTQLEIGRGSTVLTRVSRSRLPTVAPPEVRVVELPNSVQLSWDAATFPYAMVSGIKNGERTTYGLNLTGGWAEVLTGPEEPAEARQIEISLSDGINTVSQIIGR